LFRHGHTGGVAIKCPPMLQLILNHDHLISALAEALELCRHRLFIATADVKDLYLPAKQSSQVAGKTYRRAKSILEIFHVLARRGVEVRLLHSGVPSGPFLHDLKKGLPDTLTMRRCVRVHAKAVIADGRWMYLGSANLTGAGLGAKSERRRNFESGIWTDQTSLIDPVLDMLDSIWEGKCCRDCGRTENCPVPLEEPQL
jgi:phosphatidylserine/phosphatidylglycerophosphate/cardiolipin synthase-like enzyme